MEVTKYKESLNKKCDCQNWLKHWMTFRCAAERPNCSVLNCTEEAIVGSHVTQLDKYDKNVYIAPMCLYHNTVRDRSQVLCEDTKLVSSELLNTCDPISEDARALQEQYNRQHGL